MDLLSTALRGWMSTRFVDTPPHRSPCFHASAKGSRSAPGGPNRPCRLEQKPRVTSMWNHLLADLVGANSVVTCKRKLDESWTAVFPVVPWTIHTYHHSLQTNQLIDDICPTLLSFWSIAAILAKFKINISNSFILEFIGLLWDKSYYYMDMGHDSWE